MVRVLLLEKQMNLLDNVVKSLSSCRGRWPDVSEASGVPVSTVRKIAQGVSKDPGVKTVQRLLDYFERQGKLKKAA